MTEKDNYLLVSLDDETEQSKAISEVLSSKTSKKIINYLTEVKEASQKDLSDKLKIPLNTIEYNIKKLLSSGLIRKRKNFFWSKKGKKIIMYELSKKSVVISHKKSTLDKLKSILPAFILTSVCSFALWTFQKISSLKTSTLKISEESVRTASDFVDQVPSPMVISSQGTPVWMWFFAGSLITILIISIVNWRKL